MLLYILHKDTYTYISFSSFGYYRVILLITGYIMLYDAMLCYVMLQYVVLGEKAYP